MIAKNLSQLGIVAALVLSSAIAQAGGVSDGGGGTTNPFPAQPEWVVQGAQYAGNAEQQGQRSIRHARKV